MRLRRALALPAAAALTLALAACGASTDTTADATDALTADAATEDAATGDAETGFPITLQHAFGETTIEAQPEAPAAVAWSNGTTAIALGVVPVGIAAATYGVEDGSGMLPWTKEALAELGGEPVLFDETDGINFEELSAADPDVILASYSGITAEEYDTLSQIAPTVAYPEIAWGTTWRDEITMESTALGLAAEGQDLIADLEAQIAEATAARPEIAGKTVAMAWIDPTDLSTISLYSPVDNRVQYLLDLGLTTPDSVASLTEGNDSFFVSVSSENADQLADIDVLVAYGDEALLTAIQADPLLGTIPAIQRGSVALFADGTPLAAAATPDALSIPWALNDYLDVIAAAAAKVG